MATFKKKRVLPKQIKHWIYRLTGKSGGVAYIASYTPHIHIPIQMHFKGDNRLVRFAYCGLQVEIREYVAFGMSFQAEPMVSWNTTTGGRVSFHSIRQKDFPKTYESFCELVEQRRDAVIFESL